MHPCEVQALAKSRCLRVKEVFTYGHALHECGRDRPGFREHDGDHLCRCGLEWAPTDTDNGPPLRARRL